MNKHVANPSDLKRLMRSTLAAFVVTLLALTGLTFVSSSAKAAITLDVLSSTFNFDYPTNGTTISSGSKETTGSIVKYSNVTGTPVDGVTIDAVVTMTLNNSAILPIGTGNSNGTYDSPGKAGSDAKFFQVDTSVSAAYGYASFKFDFYEGGTYTGPNTGTPVVLKNLSVTTIDIDGGQGYCQYTDFTGFQSYYLSTNSAIQVKTNANDPTHVAAGVTRFFAGSCNSNSNRIEDAAQVKFDAVSTFTTRFGTDVTAGINYFGIGFKTLSAIFGGTQPAGVNNPSNQPPTSSNTTRYYVNGQASLVQLQDFGTYSDPDGNPFLKVQITALPTAGTLEKFVNGSWVAVALNDQILVSDINNGNLRYTGTANSTLQFKVSDGTAYSTSAYTMSLLVANQSQSITFNNPGAKTPTSPSFASGATATSGLTVTLTSLTPGVCTVSGLNIVPVAAGTCTIVATQAGNSSYGAAAPVTQTFPISTLTAQTITSPSPGNKTWTGSSTTVTVTPTASSNLTVSLYSLSPSVCTVSGLVITIVGPGNCTIRNSQAGNGTYSSAPPVEYTFVVAAPASSYTLTYNANSPTTGTVPTSETGSGNKTLATNSGTLAKTGYSFSGWNTQANGSGTHYATGATYNLTADVTLYAEWTALSYTLTYDGNSSDGGTVPSSQTGYGNLTAAANLGLLTRSGYTFTGWNTQANGSGTHYNIGATYNLTADVTLYAEWATSTYTIFYDGNGNSGGAVPSSQTGNGNVTLATNSGTLALTGYTFNGWNTLANGTGTHYAVSATYNLNTDVTLYAEWVAVPATFTITYDGNGKLGGAVPGSQTGNGNVTLATNSGTLTKTGYTFNGWNTLGNGTGTHFAVSATYNLNADVTLYAEWAAVITNFTITYRGNGNTGGAVGPDTVGADGSTVTTDNNTGSLVKTGYRFNGWNTAANGTGTTYEEGTSIQITGNLTLYAVWVPLSFTITFDGNTSTSGSAPTSVTGYGAKTITNAAGTLVKTGYIFKGWNTQADGLGTRLGTSYNLIADVTLYAEWQLIPAIIYSPNGATGGTTPNDIPNGSPITIDPNTGNLIRAGYRFLGWNTQPNGGGTHYGAGMTPILPEGTVLYAEWAKLSSLASTGSTYGEEISGATALIGLGVFLNAIASIRRRRVRKH